MPAVDILNLKDNKGSDLFERDFSLLFAASGDIQNVIRPLQVFLRTTGASASSIYDMDFDIVAKNTILLLLALYYDAKVAVPIIIHV